MKASELVPIFEKIVENIPILNFYKRNLFIYPVGSLLRGVHFDPSAFSKDRFNVRAFIMPLCEKTEHYHFTFGKMIYLKSEDWSVARPDLVSELTDKILKEAMPYLQQATTLRDFACRPEIYGNNPHGPKMAAYCFARIGETAKAVAMIEEYLPKLDLSSLWQKEIAEESRALRHLLIYQPEMAKAKLEDWENETIRNLELERFR